jgi:hypothetical protein
VGLRALDDPPVARGRRAARGGHPAPHAGAGPRHAGRGVCAGGGREGGLAREGRAPPRRACDLGVGRRVSLQASNRAAACALRTTGSDETRRPRSRSLRRRRRCSPQGEGSSEARCTERGARNCGRRLGRAAVSIRSCACWAISAPWSQVRGVDALALGAITPLRKDERQREAIDARAHTRAIGRGRR